MTVLITPPKNNQPQAGRHQQRLRKLICKSISCVREVAAAKYLVAYSKHIGVSEGTGAALAVRTRLVATSWGTRGRTLHGKLDVRLYESSKSAWNETFPSNMRRRPPIGTASREMFEDSTIKEQRRPFVACKAPSTRQWRSSGIAPERDSMG